MKEMVAAVKPNGHQTPNSAVAGPPDVPSGASPQAAGKFTYPGGSSPLEGYTIKRGVGQGGFGEIYYALSDAGKEVALKLIRRNLDVELRGIRQCLNLKHPNLIDLYDIRQDAQGDTWVVMEYVSGICLQDAVENSPQGMPVDQVLAWIHGIGAAVAYLHDHGIVHRDLKPGNVFSNEGVVKVGDYGLSKFISCSRRSGHTESIGTVHYMAPEVANGRYGKEIDVYAMGVILYEMLTGRVPFEGESVGEVLMKHLTAKPDVSMLPEPFRGVVARALEKDPVQRYRSAAEMLAALPQPTQALPGMGRLPSGQPYADIPPGAGYHDHLAETIVPEEADDEEPVLRTIKQAWTGMRKTWHEADLPPLVKLGLMIGAIFVLMTGGGMIFSATITLFFVYCFYRLIRAFVLAWQGPKKKTASGAVAANRPQFAPLPEGQAGASPGAVDVQEQRREELRAARKRFEKVVPTLVLGTPRERFAELLGSLLLSPLVAVAMTVVMVLVGCYFNNTFPRPEQCAWLLMTTIAGAWMVLIPAKFWEGSSGDPALRRFVMMMLGLGLGGLAYLIAAGFLVSLPPSPHFRTPHYNLPQNFYSFDGRPMLMAYLACFGLLFCLLRWWPQADPLRRKRLSVWTLLVTVTMAGLIAMFLDFPQPWLPMAAGAISITVQLSSPWVQPRKIRG